MSVSERWANVARLPQLDDWPEAVPKPAGVDVVQERVFYVAVCSDVEHDERFDALSRVTDPVRVLITIWGHDERCARLYPKG